MLVRFLFIVISFSLGCSAIADVVIDPNSRLNKSELGYRVKLNEGLEGKLLNISIDGTQLIKCMAIREFGIYNRNTMTLLGNYKWPIDRVERVNMEIDINVKLADIKHLKAVMFYKYVRGTGLSEALKNKCSRFSNVAVSRDVKELLVN